LKKKEPQSAQQERGKGNGSGSCLHVYETRWYRTVIKGTMKGKKTKEIPRQLGGSAGDGSCV